MFFCKLNISQREYEIQNFIVSAQIDFRLTCKSRFYKIVSFKYQKTAFLQNGSKKKKSKFEMLCSKIEGFLKFSRFSYIVYVYGARNRQIKRCFQGKNSLKIFALLMHCLVLVFNCAELYSSWNTSMFIWIKIHLKKLFKPFNMYLQNLAKERIHEKKWTT